MPKKQNPATISPAENDTTTTEDNIAFEKPSGKNENSMAKLPTPTTKSLKYPREENDSRENKDGKRKNHF